MKTPLRIVFCTAIVFAPTLSADPATGFLELYCPARTVLPQRPYPVKRLLRRLPSLLSI